MALLIAACVLVLLLVAAVLRAGRRSPRASGVVRLGGATRPAVEGGNRRDYFGDTLAAAARERASR